MNIQEYISSGIVQSYVLGLADDKEREEFERMCVVHVEVRAAREEFERALEEYMVSGGIQPAANVKGKVFSAIGMERSVKGNSQTDGGATPFFKRGEAVSRAQAPRSAVVRNSPQRLLPVAAVILLLISVGFNFYLYNRSEQYGRQLGEYENVMKMMRDPMMMVVKMPAMPDAPDPSSVVTVYWDKRTRDVFLSVHKLPAPAAEQQYQLWAMVDGKPVNAGVFDLKDNRGVIKMKNMPRAEAFAVTLEKRGGSPEPSMDKIYVMGRV